MILLLAEGERPDEPVHEQFTPRIWSLTKKCWRKDPEKRPDIPKVLKKLESRDGAFSFTHGNLRASTQEAPRKEAVYISSCISEHILRISNEPSVWRGFEYNPLVLFPAARHAVNPMHFASYPKLCLL